MINYRFKLCPRLYACARLVRDGKRVADVGADHAYIAIWLAKNNITNKIIATDLRKGPLINAEKNILKYGLKDQVDLRLSDGFKNINENEAEDIIIAGMGGELIKKITKDVKWLKDSNKRLILQPMSDIKKLRVFLKEERFEIKKEIAVVSGNKVYIVMVASFSEKEIVEDEMYPYLGKLRDNLNFETIRYIEREIKSLCNKIEGLKIKSEIYEACYLENVVFRLKKIIERRC